MGGKLRVYRGSRILGEFSRNEIHDGLSNGTFFPDDYFWDSEDRSSGLQKLANLRLMDEKQATSKNRPANFQKHKWKEGLGHIAIAAGLYAAATAFSDFGILDVLMIPEEARTWLSKVFNGGFLNGVLLVVIGALLLKSDT